MSTTAPPHVSASARLEKAMAQIPLAQAMQIAVGAFARDELILEAPLSPNVNDKGCAFGGSLVSLMTLAGWGLVLLRLEAAGHDCDIYVQDSSTHYREPLWSDLRAHATISDGEESWDSFLASLAARGRGRVRVACRIPTLAGADACTLDARFVAIARNRAATG